MEFPVRLRFNKPTSAELADRFDEARTWIATTETFAPCRVEWRELKHRRLGSNEVPHRVWLDSFDDAIRLLGRSTRSQVEAFDRIVAETATSRPELLAWVAKHPLRSLELEDVWTDLLRVLDWMESNPNSGAFLRQVDLAGIDTKFIESHRRILAEMADLAVPAVIVNPTSTGVRGFEQRFGFASRPRLIRFRSLDSAVRPLGLRSAADMTVDSATFAEFGGHPWLGAISTVLVVENEINFLCLPQASSTLAVFGAGYGLEHLAKAEWIRSKQLVYWGDLDTHGFAILNDLRGYFDHVESVLMDSETLLGHRRCWVPEMMPVERPLPHLRDRERHTLALLCDDTERRNAGPEFDAATIRLEQERIGFRWMQDRLNAALR